MKFFKLFLLSGCLTILFASCGRKNIGDVVSGTPTNADTVLAPSKHAPLSPKELESYQNSLPKVFQR